MKKENEDWILKRIPQEKGQEALQSFFRLKTSANSWQKSILQRKGNFLHCDREMVKKSGAFYCICVGETEAHEWWWEDVSKEKGGCFTWVPELCRSESSALSGRPWKEWHIIVCLLLISHLHPSVCSISLNYGDIGLNWRGLSIKLLSAIMLRHSIPYFQP